VSTIGDNVRCANLVRDGDIVKLLILYYMHFFADGVDAFNSYRFADTVRLASRNGFPSEACSVVRGLLLRESSGNDLRSSADANGCCQVETWPSRFTSAIDGSGSAPVLPNEASDNERPSFNDGVDRSYGHAHRDE